MVLIERQIDVTWAVDLIDARARNDQIRARRAAGEHPPALAREYGISRQRVEQIAHPTEPKY